MERLTFEGNFCDIAQCDVIPGGSHCESGSCTQRKSVGAAESLRGHGMTPEEILPKDKADEIALKLMRLADLESLCNYTRLRELAEADRDGRLVVLPCKVGDTVYFRTYDCNGTVDLGIQPHKVTAIVGHAIVRGKVYRCRAVAGPVWSKLLSHPRGGGEGIGGNEK